MPRDLLAEGRFQHPKQNPDSVYAAAANVAMGELVERWKSGFNCGQDARVENVHLHDDEGNLVGFRLYFVAGEPAPLGKARVEVIKPE